MHSDSNLSWALHVEILLKKLSIACYMMKNLYYYLILHSLKTIYFTHFQSLLQFGIIFWSTTTNLHKALTMQKRIIRVMLGLRHRSSCRQKFKKLQILTVSSAHILEMMMFVIKHHTKYQTNDSNHSKDIRPKKIHLLSIRLSSGQKGVCSSSIRILINFHHTLYNCMKIQWTLRTL